ncbi:MAG: flagellar hook protein FlgE [Terracidiphilus sp.]
MGSFATALSGLNAAQSMLQTISNNLANMNTDGYKDQSLTFGDIYAQATQTNGSGDPIQTGYGVNISGTDSNFGEGNLSATGIASNMALSGNGFFVTQGINGLPSYTRSGDFSTNNSGFIVTPGGELVMGYPAANGVVNTSAALQGINVSNGLTSPPVASTTVGVTANLDSSTAVGGTATGSSLTVYDSLGQAHTLTVSYTKTAANTWTYSVSVPSADITGGVGTSTMVGTGTLNFSNTGQLLPTSTIGAISIPTLADGAKSPLALTGPFGTAANPTITQTDLASATSATSTDGYASGTLSSYAIQPNGTVEGTFSSGQTLALGQVAVANFANNEGLSSVGNNAYQATTGSGQAIVGVAGTGAAGTIVGGSVEQSNVNIASEFSNLIVAQQAYGANAKSITTLQQLSQAALAMIQ